MSASLPAFVKVLLRRGVVTPAHVEQCRTVVTTTGTRWESALVRLGHATDDEVIRAKAEALHLRVIDLAELVVPPEVIELMPESVARENVVLPVAVEANLLVVATSDPGDGDVLQKLAFILNRHIQFVLAPREEIAEAIDRHYGNTETESVDSMLAEFTDTAIDFTETDGGWKCDDAPPSATAGVRRKARRSVERRATVRYYERMNPDRLYPLLVVLSRAEIEKVAQAGVGQKQSTTFRVEAGSVVEIEPILPGCDCYPPRAQATVTDGEVRAEFWVAPHVVGPLRAARVVVRQDGRPLAEVPLEACVSREAATWLLAGLSCVLPFVLLLLKHFRLDFESQSQDGFGVYAHAANWVIQMLTPETLTVLLLIATLGLYLWLRPRRRDLFWDIKPVAEAEAEAAGAGEPEEELQTCREAIERGDRKAGTYSRAAIAAHRLGDTVEALVILRQAEVDLGPDQLTPGMWYNMACFAALLGQTAAALGYLRKAVAAGYDNADKMRTDPDLASVRSSAEYRRLLAGISVGV